jgi:site-specific recombinase XerD
VSKTEKSVLIRKIASELGEELSEDQLNNAMRIISSSINQYEVEPSAGALYSIDNTELIGAYLSAKEIEGRSKKTIERYRYCINRLVNAVQMPLSEMTVFHIRRYLMEVRASGSSERTVEGYRAVYHSFFGWLNREGLLENNPCANISAIKCPKTIRRAFSDTDIERLAEACGSNRDRAVLYFLLSTGCRISEVCALDRADVDLSALQCIVNGKGAKQRKVYLSDVAAMYLLRYFAERKDDLPSLFVGKGTERMTPGGVRALLKRLERDSGVENVHPHRFRRTLATSLINHGMGIQEVAVILGHDRLETTMKYLVIAEDNVRNSYHKYA